MKQYSTQSSDYKFATKVSKANNSYKLCLVTNPLEEQFVGSGVFGEGESRFKVLSEEFSLFNGSEDGAIDFSLSLSSGSDLVLFSLSFLENYSINMPKKELFTSGAPAAKKASSDFLVFLTLILLKNSSLRASALTPEMSTLVEVGMTVDWLTLLRGTPLSLKGPVTKRRPDLSCLKKTTLLPLNLPTKRIKTVPGVMFLLRV